MLGKFGNKVATAIIGVCFEAAKVPVHWYMERTWRLCSTHREYV